MTLPDWSFFVRPVLSILSDGQRWKTSELREAVAHDMDLTEEERSARIPSGQLQFENRVGWALTGLRRAKAVTKEGDGYSTITSFGYQLLADNPVQITRRVLKEVPAYQAHQPLRRAYQRSPNWNPSTWFVGAYYYGEEVEDQTEKFLAEGIWRNGYEDKYRDEVKSIQSGERIAIKAAYTRLKGLPFDSKGNRVSVMAIKATGTVIRNHGDGRTIDVDWDPLESEREWYFYTNRLTVWQLSVRDWKNDALIGFAFHGEEQDIDRFRNAPYWAEKFGNDAGSAIPRIDEPGEERDDELPGIEEGFTLDDVVAEGCFVREETLQDYLRALREKKNLILQGPPGTGKTWLAKRLGYALIGAKDRTLLRAIQFHPTIAYEDFVRGWRPSGEGKLALEDGLFLDIVNAAHADPGHDHVLVIEEINRGNISQIFGELLTLLESEKRTPEEALELSYRRKGEVPTYLPENLYIIGTMNLADRSLAIVDVALRRRFAFAELEPRFGVAWRTWVSEKNGISSEFLSALGQRINVLNEAIARERSLGVQYRIGHSFFTPPLKSSIVDPQAWLRRTVDHEVRPLLSEYWFDDSERVENEVSLLLGEVL